MIEVIERGQRQLKGGKQGTRVVESLEGEMQHGEREEGVEEGDVWGPDIHVSHIKMTTNILYRVLQIIAQYIIHGNHDASWVATQWGFNHELKKKKKTTSTS